MALVLAQKRSKNLSKTVETANQPNFASVQSFQDQPRSRSKRPIDRPAAKSMHCSATRPSSRQSSPPPSQGRSKTRRPVNHGLQPLLCLASSLRIFCWVSCTSVQPFSAVRLPSHARDDSRVDYVINHVILNKTESDAKCCLVWIRAV